MNQPAPHAHHHHPRDNDDCESFGKRCVRWATVGTALAAGAVIVSPYVLPLVGIGEASDIVDIMTTLHADAGSAGSGIAGAINKGISAVPLVGEELAKGGLTTAITSGALGVGGMILGRYITKREDGKHSIKWGKVISTAALAASALIALPTALTGITAGIVFLSSLYDTQLASEVLTSLAGTVGYANSEGLAASSISTASIAVPHLLTCGAAALPAIFSFGSGKHSSKHKVPEASTSHAAQPATVTAQPAVAAHDHSYAANDGKDAVLAHVSLEKPTTAGEQVRGVLVLKHADSGKPLTVDELKYVNEAHIHFFINNSSLTDYHHIHPIATDKPGEYAFDFKAATSQPYTGFAAIVKKDDNKHRSLKVSFPPAINRYVPPNVRMNSQVDVDGLSFDWKMDGPMQAGKPSNIEVTIKDAQGKAVTDLQPVFGEWSHLEGFTANHGTMLHTHPTGREPQGKDDRMGSPLHFTITPDKDGPTQFYVQVKRGDKDIYAPIGQYVKAPEKATDRVTARSGSYFSSAAGYGMA